MCLILVYFQMNLSPDEQDLYTEWLSKMEVAFY